MFSFKFRLTLSSFLILTVPNTVYGIYEVPEIIPLPPYFGCFHSSLYSEVPHDSEGTQFYFNPGGVLPAECILFCLRNSTLGFDIAAIKEKMCICSRSVDASSFRHFVKVSDSSCNLPCGRKIHKIIYINENCGGIVPYSIYCAVTLTGATGAAEKFCSKLWISSVQENKNVTVGDFVSMERFEKSCVTCIDDSFICPTLSSNSSSAIIGFDYFPKNSTLDCINYCRRLISTNVDFIALQGKSAQRINNRAVETCFCTKSESLEIQGFVNATDKYGTCTCSPEYGQNCPEYFVAYGIFSRPVQAPTTLEPCDTPEPPPSTTEASTKVVSDPDDDEWDDCDSTETTLSTSTEETTESEVISTTSVETTPAPTTEPTSISTVETTVDTTNSTTEVTSIPTTTTKLTTTTKSAPTSEPETTTEYILLPSPNTTTSRPCAIECVHTDEYEFTWRACAGGYGEKPCDVLRNGTIYWKCLENGNFWGPKNYSNCSTPWIDKIKNELVSETDLHFSKAVVLLKQIEDHCDKAKDWDRESYYFGHQIDDVMELGLQIMNLVQVEQISLYEDLSSFVSSITEKVLVYPEVWKQLSAEERSTTGYQLMNIIEDTFFIISTKFIDDRNEVRNDRIYHFAPNNPDSQFNTETGVVLKSRSKGQVLRFPRDADKDSGKTYVELPDDWAESMSSSLDDGGDEVEFVGIRLCVSNASLLFDPEPDEITDNCTIEADACIERKTIMNGDMISFTFGNQTNRTEFSGKGVRITFQHDVIAWGTSERPVRRKLHDGERAKGIQTSAACMYWDVVQKDWSSLGCKVIEAGETQTICECNHLTAFALLMDVHNYEGKEFWLELLTFILTPISCICLVMSIFVLSRIKDVQGPRTTITRNLSITLLIGMILVITLMDRSYIYLGDTLCTIVAVVIHFVFLSAFIWMGLEGLLLYRMVILVFDTQRHYMNYQRAGAILIPVLIIGATYVIGLIKGERAYGGDEFCWLEGNYKWGFMGPVALISLVNLFVLVTTLRKASDMQKTPKSKSREKRKKSLISWIRGAFGVTVILGTTWSFGFLMAIPNKTISQIGAYIFTILNASQGIFVFVFHCLLNQKVRESLGGKLPAWVTMSTSATSTNSNSSKFRFMKKSDVISISSDDSTWSRRHNTRNDVEQIGRRELVPDF